MAASKTKEMRKLRKVCEWCQIPLILLLVVDNKFVTGFLVQQNLFNNFFSQQCSTVVKSSSIPINVTVKTENRLCDSVKVTWSKSLGYKRQARMLVAIKYLSVWWNYVPLQSQSHGTLYLKTAQAMTVFLKNGRSQMLFLFLKRVIRNWLIIIDSIVVANLC